jgi:hypothetical protein
VQASSLQTSNYGNDSPRNNLQETFRIARRNVARLEPSSRCDGALRCLNVVQVPPNTSSDGILVRVNVGVLHDIWSADPQLAALAWRDIVLVIID